MGFCAIYTARRCVRCRAVTWLIVPHADFLQIVVLAAFRFVMIVCLIGRSSQTVNDWVNISMFLLEFIVGICMLVIVGWLALFRMKEIDECWKIHARIRYYFGLTLIGTVVNLTLGTVGMDFVFHNRGG